MTTHELIESLEEDIIFGHLHPRERLVETELMDKYKVKRHIVRSALTTLSKKGIVTQEANKGSRVADINKRDIEEIYFMRENLTKLGFQTVHFPIAENIIDQLKLSQLQHDQAVIDDDARAVLRANETFHSTLNNIFENTLLIATLEELEQKANLVRSHCIGEEKQLMQSKVEHHKIIEALEKGNGQKACERLLAHMLRAKEVYLSKIKKRH